MKSSALKITVFTIFTTLYTVLVVFLAPVSFGIYQVRLADCLLPLSMIFGIPSVLGLSLGAVLSNFYGGLGVVDVVGGSFANLIACFLAYYISQKRGVISRFIGSVIQTIVITLIVGGYLAILFQVPLEIGLIGVMIGSIISINLLGFPIEELLRKNKFVIKYFLS